MSPEDVVLSGDFSDYRPSWVTPFPGCGAPSSGLPRLTGDSLISGPGTARERRITMTEPGGDGRGLWVPRRTSGGGGTTAVGVSPSRPPRVGSDWSSSRPGAQGGTGTVVGPWSGPPVLHLCLSRVDGDGSGVRLRFAEGGWVGVPPGRWQGQRRSPRRQGRVGYRTLLWR